MDIKYVFKMYIEECMSFTRQEKAPQRRQTYVMHIKNKKIGLIIP